MNINRLSSSKDLLLTCARGSVVLLWLCECGSCDKTVKKWNIDPMGNIFFLAHVFFNLYIWIISFVLYRKYSQGQIGSAGEDV